MSYVFGILFLKNKYKIVILAISANIFGTTICFAYSVNPIPKKSADTILTKLLTTNGKDVVSAINPLAIIKGKTIFSSQFNALTIAKTIGVKIIAAPSLAKRAATKAPNTETRINIISPLSFATLAIWRADHLKNPISSRINEIIMIAINANVAFQTIFVTSHTF